MAIGHELIRRRTQGYQERVGGQVSYVRRRSRSLCLRAHVVRNGGQGASQVRIDTLF